MAYASSYDEFEQPRSVTAVYWLIGLCVGVYFVQATLIGDANMARALGYSPGERCGKTEITHFQEIGEDGNHDPDAVALVPEAFQCEAGSD